jgi:mannose-1-phosphate guanylyltransferase
MELAMPGKRRVAGAADGWALVLAGGDGTRLQELTRRITGAPIPKQYCPLLNGCSMLEATLLRARHFAPAERTLVVVNQYHLGIAGTQLRHVPAANVIVQPRNCDTGPGILLALLELARRCANATVAVFPSDHYVSDDRAFMKYVAEAAQLVDRSPENLALLGIAPDRPETGYGYILPGEPVSAADAPRHAFRVRAFHEKPDAQLAKTLCDAGGLWNSFVTVFRLDRLFALLRRKVPEHFARLARLRKRPQEVADVYRSLTPWNFSTAVLARVPERLIALRVENVHWNDWGTQASIEHSFRLFNCKPPWDAVAQTRSSQADPEMTILPDATACA